MKITKTLTAMAVALAATTGTSAVALDELVVGYFMEWPTANQYAQHNKYLKATFNICHFKNS